MGHGKEIRGPEDNLGDEILRRPRRKWATGREFRGLRIKWATKFSVAHFLLGPRNSLFVAHSFWGDEIFRRPSGVIFFSVPLCAHCLLGPRISFPSSLPSVGLTAAGLFWATLFLFVAL